MGTEFKWKSPDPGTLEVPIGVVLPAHVYRSLEWRDEGEHDLLTVYIGWETKNGPFIHAQGYSGGEAFKALLELSKVAVSGEARVEVWNFDEEYTEAVFLVRPGEVVWVEVGQEKPLEEYLRQFSAYREHGLQ